MKKLFSSALGAAMMLGAAAASAQGLPPYYGQSSDLPWSINHQPPRDLNAYNSVHQQQDQAMARQDRVSKPQTSVSTVGRSSS